ncbi:sulfotransferase [Acrocarpospora macrocephala]|uniref:Putative sulfotransferase n=1 Tax=Acrocarpospora macrocephala TaxID=150177 RepID=A0A5M3X3Z7_9ACTN|nr:sulfotransferase [Acrocarpospora macrocephala]GES15790.1 putative sulfotransferase [Acrocarpospora macrocephala]
MLKGIPRPRRADLTERALAFQNPRLPIPLRVAARLPFARMWWPLDASALKAKARRRTRLTDFGELAPLDVPLELLCRTLDEDAELHALGRLSTHYALLVALSNRLRLEDLARRRPQVFERPVTGPIVIAGLPRSGTTFLHRLLARDPGLRSIPFWEALNPMPFAEPIQAPDPRIKAGARVLKFIRWNAPEAQDRQNEAPEEEVMPLAMGFSSMFFETISPLPGYLPWYVTTDHTAGYVYLRRALQAMQWIRPAGERWLLKSPQHLEQFGPLTAAFPDGTFVQTHRDPIRSVLSLSATMSYASRQNYHHPDPHLIGRHVTDLTERLLRASVRDRARADRRFVDVHFAQLNADPMATVRRIYAATGTELTEETERLMTVWYPRHRRGRHGVHSYDAADFGLSVPALRERFAFYYDHFGVPREGH